MERSEQLKSGGLRFFYDDTLFRPCTDSFLLSAFPRLSPGLRVCDLGCGAGLIGMLLLQRQPDLFVTGMELQPEALAYMEKNAAENSLGTRLTALRGDLRQVRQILPAGSFDLVVCNPPYYPSASGALSHRSETQGARAELFCTLEDVCAAAAYLLRWSGSFCLVHKPERLTDVLCAMRQWRVEPKRLRPVCKSPGAAPSLLLLEGRRGGKPGLSLEPALILQTPSGAPTAEVDAIYFRTQEDMP